MTISVEAIYDNGFLKPVQPLPLKDQQKVQITIHTEPSLARQTAGLIRLAGRGAAG